MSGEAPQQSEPRRPVLPLLDAPWRSRVILAAALPALVLLGGLIAGRYTLAAGDQPAKLAGQVEPGRAHAWLATFQERYGFRERGSQAHAEAPPFIRDALLAAGAVDARLQPERPDLVNVLARIPGRDPSVSVVVGAHHDVVPGAPGAIDDGGAIAAIVEAARVLAAADPPPACDVVLAIFDGEEYGDLGSKAYVQRLGDAGRARVKAAVAVELVGWTEDQLVVHTIPHGFAWDAEGIAPAWLPAAVRTAAGQGGVVVGLGDPIVATWYQPTIRVLGVRTGSDAGAFLERGIPACMLTGSALTNFYAGYHRPSDSMERVSAERLDDAARAIAAAAIELAALPPERATRDLGEPYLVLGDDTLGRAALTLLGLSVLLPLGLAGWRLGAARRSGPCVAFFVAGGALAILSALADVLGLVLGVPLCWTAALAACLGRGAGWTLLAGRGVLWVELLLVAAASAMFGFRWHGEPVATALTCVVCVAGVLAGTTLKRAQRRS